MSISGGNTEPVADVVAPPRRSRAVLVLSVLVVLFAIGAGVFGTLFVLEQSKHADTVARIPAQVAEESVKQSGAKFEEKDRAFAVLNAKLLLSEQLERKATMDRDGMTNTIRALSECTIPAKDLIRAAGKYDTAEAKTAITLMTRNCR